MRRPSRIDVEVGYNLQTPKSWLFERLVAGGHVISVVIYTLMLWPLVCLSLLRRPHLHAVRISLTGKGEGVRTYWAATKAEVLPDDQQPRNPAVVVGEPEHLFDVRIILAAQMIGAIACIVVWVVVNVLVKQYE